MNKYKVKEVCVSWKDDNGNIYFFHCATTHDAVVAAKTLGCQHEEIETLLAKNEKMRAVVDAAIVFYDSDHECNDFQFEALLRAVEKYKTKAREQLLDERLAAADALAAVQGCCDFPDLADKYISAKKAHEEAES